jgi:hypothetical protein
VTVWDFAASEDGADKAQLAETTAVARWAIANVADAGQSTDPARR